MPLRRAPTPSEPRQTANPWTPKTTATSHTLLQSGRHDLITEGDKVLPANQGVYMMSRRGVRKLATAGADPSRQLGLKYLRTTDPPCASTSRPVVNPAP